MVVSQSSLKSHLESNKVVFISLYKILSSLVDAHLQKILDICDSYSSLKRIKFNATKSSLMEFGPQFFKESNFNISNTLIPNDNHITYLGVKNDINLDFKDLAIEKFKNVQRSVCSLSFLGLKLRAILPKLQGFILKIFCLSQFTYSL